jgi:hypothetical protein
MRHAGRIERCVSVYDHSFIEHWRIFVFVISREVQQLSNGSAERRPEALDATLAKIVINQNVPPFAITNFKSNPLRNSVFANLPAA